MITFRIRKRRGNVAKKSIVKTISKYFLKKPTFRQALGAWRQFQLCFLKFVTMAKIAPNPLLFLKSGVEHVTFASSFLLVDAPEDVCSWGMEHSAGTYWLRYTCLMRTMTVKFGWYWSGFRRWGHGAQLNLPANRQWPDGLASDWRGDCDCGGVWWAWRGWWCFRMPKWPTARYKWRWIPRDPRWNAYQWAARNWCRYCTWS